MTAGWVGARLGEAADRHLSPSERRLARAKDVMVGVVALTGLATATFSAAWDGDAASVKAAKRQAAGRTRIMSPISSCHRSKKRENKNSEVGQETL